MSDLGLACTQKSIEKLITEDKLGLTEHENI